MKRRTSRELSILRKYKRDKTRKARNRVVLVAVPSREHEDAVAARVVRCGFCGWSGSYSGLRTASGTCPYCKREAWLEVE